MDPSLYEARDFAYHVVADQLPVAWQARSELIAGICGVTGAALASGALQRISRHVVDKVFPGFHYHVAPYIEYVLMTGAVGVALFQPFIDPEAFREYIQQHPTDFVGTASAIVGGLTVGITDLAITRNILPRYQRRIANLEQQLEDQKHQ